MGCEDEGRESEWGVLRDLVSGRGSFPVLGAGVLVLVKSGEGLGVRTTVVSEEQHFFDSAPDQKKGRENEMNTEIPRTQGCCPSCCGFTP